MGGERSDTVADTLTLTHVLLSPKIVRGSFASAYCPYHMIGTYRETCSITASTALSNAVDSKNAPFRSWKYEGMPDGAPDGPLKVAAHGNGNRDSSGDVGLGSSGVGIGTVDSVSWLFFVRLSSNTQSVPS